MRIVGKAKTETSLEEKWLAGVRASDLMKSLGVPSFRQGGVFRGSPSWFNQLDTERMIRKQRWLNEHIA